MTGLASGGSRTSHHRKEGLGERQSTKVWAWLLDLRNVIGPSDVGHFGTEGDCQRRISLYATRFGGHRLAAFGGGPAGGGHIGAGTEIVMVRQASRAKL